MTHVAPAPERASSSAEVCVRPARRSDEDAVRALLARLDLGYPSLELASFSVAERRGEVVGVAELRRIGGHRLLSCVGVREDLQGRGIGTELVSRLLEDEREDVHLYTLRPAFFERAGFSNESVAPPGLPGRDLYGCEGCDPARCHRMVRRGARAAALVEGPLDVRGLAALAPLLPGGDEVTTDLGAASLWIWRGCEAPHVRVVGGSICLLLEPHHERPYFLEPIGGGDEVAAVAHCLASGGRVSRVRTGLARRLPAERFGVAPLRDHFDYVIDTRSVAALNGAAYVDQRNRVRKFAREHPRHEVRPLAATDRDAALALFDRWASRDADRAQSAGALPARDCQRRALEHAFEDFDLLGLGGCALVEDGVFLGLVLGSRAGPTAIAHFLHADPSAAGAAQAVLVEACRGVFADARWIDLEEDLGLPGLRRAKSSWRPVRLAEKFEVTLRA